MGVLGEGGGWVGVAGGAEREKEREIPVSVCFSVVTLCTVL